MKYISKNIRLPKNMLNEEKLLKIYQNTTPPNKLMSLLLACNSQSSACFFLLSAEIESVHYLAEIMVAISDTSIPASFMNGNFIYFKRIFKSLKTDAFLHSNLYIIFTFFSLFICVKCPEEHLVPFRIPSLGTLFRRILRSLHFPNLSNVNWCV